MDTLLQLGDSLRSLQATANPAYAKQLLEWARQDDAWKVLQKQVVAFLEAAAKAPEPAPPPVITIYVKPWMGSYIPFETYATSTVADLKKVIADTYGYPLDQFILRNTEGKTLPDYQALSTLKLPYVLVFQAKKGIELGPSSLIPPSYYTPFPIEGTQKVKDIGITVLTTVADAKHEFAALGVAPYDKIELVIPTGILEDSDHVYDAWIRSNNKVTVRILP